MPNSMQSSTASLGRADKERLLILLREKARRQAERAQAGKKTPSAEAKADPVVYAAEVFGLQVWDEQAKFLRAARDHARVTVTSGHKTGKTRSLGVLAWWFTSDPDARPEARVPMTSSSAEQLKRALWREVTALWRLATARGYDLPEPALDPATGVRWDDGREIFGFSTRDAERAAGVSGAWIKYLIDEASGVAATIFEAIEGNRAGGKGGSTSTVLASNPTQQSGEFFESHHGKRALYHALTISSEDAAKCDPPIPGLATDEWVAEKRREWGADSPVYAVRVCGRFPGSSSDAVIGVSAVLASVARWDDVPFGDAPLTIGLDVARFGDDDTVAAPRRGYKLARLHRLPPGDGPTTAAAFLVWLAGSGLVRKGETPTVNVDANGLGAAVYDSLAGEGFTHEGVAYRPREHVRAVAVNTGMAAREGDKFANLRAELHFAGRAWLDEGGALPDDAKLQAEALAPKYRMDARGRLLVSLKDDIRALIGRSPDACDAWLLSLFELDEFVPPTPPAPPPYDDSRELGAFASR